jgi:hypothetical protein
MKTSPSLPPPFSPATAAMQIESFVATMRGPRRMPRGVNFGSATTAGGENVVPPSAERVKTIDFPRPKVTSMSFEGDTAICGCFPSPRSIGTAACATEVMIVKRMRVILIIFASVYSLRI